MDGAILLTGATGLLGRYLLRDLLSGGHRVAVLVRPAGALSAEDRVAALMATWERQGYSLSTQPHVLSGDITAPDLGLSSADREWAQENCDLMLHNAASLSFVAERGQEGEPWRSNLDGTRNVLEFCRTAGIVDFHHVSTAYVCGLRTMTVLETEGNVGQQFGNDYELSKIQAEELVQRADFLSPPTIYRPSIIVGDSQTGFTTTFHGFYALVRLATTLQRAIGSAAMKDSTLPLHGMFGNECKNLVPVDYVSAVIADIVGQREEWGKTFHVLPEQPVRVDLLVSCIEELIDRIGSTIFDGSADRSNEAQQPASSMGGSIGEDLAATFYDQMKVYEAYFRDDPVFDRTHVNAATSHIPCPELDRDRLLMLARAAIAANFRHRDSQPRRVARPVRV